MRRILGVGLLLLTGTLVLAQQSSGPELNALVDGASSVTGRAKAGSAPISIFDLSFEQRTKIGQADTLDQDGKFDTRVRPTLIKGHQIVAIDRDGVAGRPVTVE